VARLESAGQIGGHGVVQQEAEAGVSIGRQVGVVLLGLLVVAARLVEGHYGERLGHGEGNYELRITNYGLREEW
jgi:hypothetical protein